MWTLWSCLSIQTKSRAVESDSVESDSVESAGKAKDKLHKACERASETRERTLHGQEQNNVHGKHESHETVINF